MPRDDVQSDLEREQTLSERSIEVCDDLQCIADNKRDALGRVCEDAISVIEKLQSNLRVTQKQLKKAVSWLRKEESSRTAAMKESRRKLMDELTATIARLKKEVLP